MRMREGYEDVWRAPQWSQTALALLCFSHCKEQRKKIIGSCIWESFTLKFAWKVLNSLKLNALFALIPRLSTTLFISQCNLRCFYSKISHSAGFSNKQNKASKCFSLKGSVYSTSTQTFLPASHFQPSQSWRNSNFHLSANWGGDSMVFPLRGWAAEEEEKTRSAGILIAS